jgi:hypothetical protein
MRLPEIGFGLVLVGCLTACAPASRVILLPQTSGQPSAVEVTAASGAQRLSLPYQTAEVSKQGQIELKITAPERVRERYGAAFTSAPVADEQFILYFEPGGASFPDDPMSSFISQLTSENMYPPEFWRPLRLRSVRARVNKAIEPLTQAGAPPMAAQS